MPDVYGPFDTAAFAQAGWYRDRGYLEPTGVQGPLLAVPTPTVGDLPLTTSGLTSSLGLGRAHVRGAYYERTGTAWTYTHPANTDPTNARIDRVVLRRDLSAKTVVPAVLQGTPAATPAPVALTQSDTGIWEMPLYQVTVPAASGTVLVVTDERPWVGSTPSASGLAVATMVQTAAGPAWGAGGYNNIGYNSAPVDSHHGWAASPNPERWTVPAGQDGIYRAMAAFTAQSVTAGNSLLVRLERNGTPLMGSNTALTAGKTDSLTAIAAMPPTALVAGDYLRATTFCNNAFQSRYTTADGLGVFMTVERIR